MQHFERRFVPGVAGAAAAADTWAQERDERACVITRAVNMIFCVSSLASGSADARERAVRFRLPSRRARGLWISRRGWLRR